MQINSHIIKLSGRAELPEALEIGSNYHVSLEGAITQMTSADNEDGTINVIYAFKPIKVEVLDPMGKTIKAKDTRGKSALFRSRIWKIWTNAKSELDFDEFYDNLMNQLIIHAEEVSEMYQ